MKKYLSLILVLAMVLCMAAYGAAPAQATKASGEVIHGKKYWISKTNGLMKEGSYTFADDGKMILN